MLLLRFLWLVGTAVCLSACAVPLGTDQDEGTGEARHYIGLVTVTDPPVAQDGVRSRRVEAVGLSVTGGLSVGYVREDRIFVPLDCRIVILVRNQAQLDEVVSRLAEIDGGRNPCVAIEPE